MKKKAHTKLGDQVKQIQSLLVQFKKVRTKCKDLAQQLKVDLPIDARYSNIQRTTLMKIQLLDLPGLINLKNSLVKILGQYFDQERELLYRKQKLEAQAKMGMMQSRNNRSKERKVSTQKRNNANSHSRSEPVNNQKIFEDAKDSMRSSQVSDLRQSRSFQIPIYKARGQTAESKMDRISKYIASLKKSMKSNTQAAGSKWRVKDYLLDQPIYLKAKAELQNFMMREQQLERLLAIAVREKLVKHFNNAPNKINQDDDYIYVRVDKPKSVHRKKKSPAKDNSSLQKRLNKEANRDHSHKKISQTKLSPAVAAVLEKQVVVDLEQMKVEVENKSENYADMFSKMSQIMEKGNQKLSEIRQKRREAFQLDDQLWDQL